jgi:tetratricopeptide (TPR) repeat protein
MNNQSNAVEPLDFGAMAPQSRIEAEVQRIRGLIETGKFAAALEAAAALRVEVPENRDVLYMFAVSQRYLGKIAQSLETLAGLEALHPRFSRLFQERGHCFLAARNPAAAINAYLQAVNINTALPASWNALKILFRAAGRHAEAETAGQHVDILAQLPVAIVTARSMFEDGEIHQAEQVVRQFLQRHGNHIEGMRLLAQIGLELDVLDDAELLLEGVLTLQPDYHQARFDYAGVLLRRHQHAKALVELDTLLQIDAKDPNYRTLRATVQAGLGNHESALHEYRALATERPDGEELQLSIAHTLKALGRQQDAIAAYRAAASIRANFGDAYWSLANLKTYRFLDEEIATMRAAEGDASTSSIDRYHLCFALGKALEDRGQYAESFAYYTRGNAFKRSAIDFRIEPIERNTRLQAATCSREFFAARAGWGCPRKDPIFIVGLPRSGSTLLEQILASHSAVEGTMELADIPRLVQRLQGRNHNAQTPAYPGVLSSLTGEQLRGFGEEYLENTRVYRTGAGSVKPFFIDKMPNNFRHIGLIHLILPNAKIIDARREPMACCFSNFKQLFASGQEFTYGIDDIARYYRTYVELMNHWNGVLPGKVLRVNHEDVVGNLEHSVRRLLDFCELDFEPACLEFYKNERSVRTASSEQVRRPIYSEGLEHWRYFEPWLAPLKQALGDLGPS